MYGDDYEEFQGRHEYQTSADPYDAPVRVSRSTERRSGSLRLDLYVRVTHQNPFELLYHRGGAGGVGFGPKRKSQVRLDSFGSKRKSQG